MFSGAGPDKPVKKTAADRLFCWPAAVFLFFSVSERRVYNPKQNQGRASKKQRRDLLMQNQNAERCGSQRLDWIKQRTGLRAVTCSCSRTIANATMKIGLVELISEASDAPLSLVPSCCIPTETP